MVLEGIQYLHQAEIIHSDIKPQSILIDDQELPKLTRFNVSNSIKYQIKSKHFTNQTITPIRGTLSYFPDEFYQNQISFKSDIYSFGVILLQVLGKVDVSAIFHPRELRELIDSYRFDTLGIKFKIFVDKCLLEEPKNRYSAAQALRDQFWKFEFSEEKPTSLPGNWSKVSLFWFFFVPIICVYPF